MNVRPLPAVQYNPKRQLEKSRVSATIPHSLFFFFLLEVCLIILVSGVQCDDLIFLQIIHHIKLLLNVVYIPWVLYIPSLKLIYFYTQQFVPLNPLRPPCSSPTPLPTRTHEVILCESFCFVRFICLFYVSDSTSK